MFAIKATNLDKDTRHHSVVHYKFNYYENLPMQYSANIIFSAIKLKISSQSFLYFSYVCSKHRLWVHVAEAVLTSTHNLCFGSKIRKKNRYTSLYPSFATDDVKVGFKGVYMLRACYPYAYESAQVSDVNG